MQKYKKTVDSMLSSFGHDPCTIYDGIMYFDNGFSICEEDREFKYKSIGGEKTEMKPHFVLMVEVVEYNYPNEPDHVDVVEVSAYLDVLSAVGEMLVMELKGKLESFFSAEFQADL